MTHHHRVTLGGKLSAVLVAAGSSVGLGNIWRFPYVAGENGGGAFLLIYIGCVLLLGLPIMVAEFAVGRSTRRNAVGAYHALDRRWSFIGYNSVLTAFLILGFYFVVSGWTAEYTVHSLTGELARHTTAEEYASLFERFITNPWRPLLYTLLFILATHAVIALGVQKGIERSAKVLMPLLFVILIALSIHALLMPGAGEGLRFLFYPDFSKVTASTLLTALGQAFFSLSVGIGTMVTYASYFKPDTNLRHTALNVSLHEVITAYLHEEWHLSRRAAAWLTTGATALLATLASLSLGVLGGWRIFGLTLFDALDFATANILLPLGGLFTCLFVGWKLDPARLHDEVTNGGKLRFRIYGLFIFLLRWVCPIILLLVFLDNLGLY